MKRVGEGGVPGRVSTISIAWDSESGSSSVWRGYQIARFAFSIVERAC